MARTGEISCADITKTYNDQKRALSSVSFTIPAKGIFSLIGRNGAGKTTLARILSTLLEPTSGKATIDGLDVMADAKRLRERMAVVPQEGRTIPWMTPVQMISSYLLWRGSTYKEAKRQAAESVAQVGLQNHADRLNSTLSGGMKRKVLVAMVIASGADYIFLDEPSTGLDPISRQDLWNILTRLSKDRFLFLTTHYLEEAEQVADHIGILDDGTLLALGTMDDLRARMKYQYSLRVAPGADLPPIGGESVVGRDGRTQIMTTREEAMDLSRALIAQNVQFAVNPVTLDDIFYRVVGRALSGDNNAGEER
jgi:ABC-2 type transport system ATP-binding protein